MKRWPSPENGILSTLTSTAAVPSADLAGDRHHSTVELADSLAVPPSNMPNRHLACDPLMPSPVTRTSVPPSRGPRLGEIACTTLPARYSYSSLLLVCSMLPSVLTSTVHRPTSHAGLEHTTSVLLTSRPTTNTSPQNTQPALADPIPRPCPDTLTAVPPLTCPTLGVSLRAVATRPYPYCTPLSVKLSPS